MARHDDDAAARASASPPSASSSGLLQFDQSISWKAGKPIATAELLRRLRALATELRGMDQDVVQPASLAPVARQLVGAHLLEHKDQGVRAFAACGLVDVLRLCAPDAPFTGSQIKAMFTFLVRQIIPLLADPVHTYHVQHKYVLASLAEVRSIVLLNDLPDADALMSQLFATLFDILAMDRGPQEEEISMGTRFNMQSVLSTLVDEATTLPPQVIDGILAQFLRNIGPVHKSRSRTVVDARQTTLTGGKKMSEAHRAAANLCNEFPEKMARYVSQYFNEVMISYGDGLAKTKGKAKDKDDEDQSDEEAHAGPTSSELKDLEKAHSLLRELWRWAFVVLPNVIPQVEAELQADDLRLRHMAVETLGDMIAGIGASGPPPLVSLDPAGYPQWTIDEETALPDDPNMPMSPKPFAEVYSSAYQAFLGRYKDRKAQVRASWATAAGNILTTGAGHVGLTSADQGALIDGIKTLLMDSEEKVRLAAIETLGHFSPREAVEILGRYGNTSKAGSILAVLADRCKDVKVPVRAKAMHVLSQWWGVASGDIMSEKHEVIETLGGIPSRIIDTYYSNQTSTNLILDDVLYQKLIPLKYPPVSTSGRSKKQPANTIDAAQGDELRVARILLFARSLDDKAKRAFLAMLARPKAYRSPLALFLKLCDDTGGGKAKKDVEKQLDGLIRYIVPQFPDAVKASIDLRSIMKLNHRALYRLLEKSTASDSDFATVYDSLKKAAAILKDKNPAALETLWPLMYRSAHLVYNKSHLTQILHFARSDSHGLGAIAHEMLNEISDKDPQIFEANIKEMCTSLVEEAPTETRPNDATSVETLKACANYIRHGKHNLPADVKFVKAIQAYATMATPAKAAKYAVSILMAMSGKRELHATELLDSSVRGFEYGETYALTKLAAVSQLVMSVPDLAVEYRDDILDIAIAQILMKTRSSDDGDTSQDIDATMVWPVETDLDDEVRAKCWSIKILVNSLRSMTDDVAIKESAPQVFDLLNRLVAQKGELSKDHTTPAMHKPRLYLLAAQSLLKLCTREDFEPFLTPTAFEKLALVVQDAQNHIRKSFLQKLQKYLVKSRLTNRFYTITLLTAYEPSATERLNMDTWIRSRAKYFHDQKAHVLEAVLPRLISLLAHHPDYADDVESIGMLTKYLVHYMACVANQDNCALLHKYAERVKQAADYIDKDASDRCYLLSEAMQTVIRTWEEKKGWSRGSWSAKIGLPKGIFGPLQNHAAAQEIADKQYLTEDADDAVKHAVRGFDKKKKRKSDMDGGAGHAKKRVKSAAHAGPDVVKRVRSHRPAVSQTPKSSTLAHRKRGKGDDDDDFGGSSKAPRRSSAPTATPSHRHSARRSSTKQTYERGSSEEEADADEEMRLGSNWADYEEQQNEDSDAESASEASQEASASKKPRAPAVKWKNAALAKRKQAEPEPAEVDTDEEQQDEEVEHEDDAEDDNPNEQGDAAMGDASSPPSSSRTSTRTRRSDTKTKPHRNGVAAKVTASTTTTSPSPAKKAPLRETRRANTAVRKAKAPIESTAKQSKIKTRATSNSAAAKTLSVYDMEVSD